MDLYFYTGRKDLAATTKADLDLLIAALADESKAANIATIARVTGKIDTLVQNDTGEPLTLAFYDDASTAASWVTDSDTTLAIGLGYLDPTATNLFCAVTTTVIAGSTRTATLPLNTNQLANALGFRPRCQFYLHIRKTTSGVTETVALLPVTVVAGVLNQAPLDAITYQQALDAVAAAQAAQTAAAASAAAAQTAAQSIPVNLSDTNPEPAGIPTPGGAVTASRSDHVHPGQLDLFFVGGQSNAVGKGDSASSPTPDATRAFLYDSGGSITTITDPVDDADTGSAWPQFASDYLRLSGRNVGLAVYAVDGSAQTAAADGGSGNWDASGSLYAAAVAHYQAAITAFEAAGWVVNVKGLLWLQGEQDAVKIGTATITASDYKAALAAMLVRFRTTFGTDFPMYMVRTGTRTGTSDTPSRELRQAQEESARADPRLIIATRETVDFPNTSQMADTVHYNQSGLNLVGARLAQAATGNVWRPYAGVKDASSALTGEPGEFVGIGVLAANAVSLTTSTVTNVTSITLTAGDWDVEGSATFIPTSATATVLRAGISTTSATLPTNNYLNAYNGPQWSGASGAAQTLPIVRQRHNLTSTTTVYLVVQPSFTAGTVTAYGQLTARRIR